MPPPDRSPLPLPAPLRLRPSFPFVGRPRELQLLRSHMPRALSEGRRIVLVGGEAGSGKSRLVREFAHDAAGEGAVVLYGACDAVVRTPYRPVVEALEELVRRTDPDDLRRDLGPGGGELARLLPDLPTRVGGLLEPVTADQDTERHRLHAAVADLLVATGRRRPVVLVCEDGHWADTPTLLLLRHLSRAALEAPMLIGATFRDAEADVPEELSEALVELRRSEGVVRVRLGGLSASEIEEFVRKAVGGEPGAELAGLAAALRDLTGGNAFLLTELWRTLVETGAVEMGPAGARLVRPLQDVATPETVREVVSQRLGRLDPETRAVLELAAVAGAEFEPAVLRRAGGLGEAELVAALDRAVRSGMIEEVPGRALAHRFAHELGVADPRERARNRLDLGDACFRAGRSQDALEAYERAGDEARTLRDGELLARAATGYELACWRMGLPDERGLGFLEEALRALDPGDSTLRVQALVGLGRALAFTGAPERSAEVREEAIAIARRLGDRRALATVLTRSYWMRGTTPFPDILDLLTEGRELAGADRPGAWRPGLASLMAELGMEAEARRELERLRAEGLEGLRPSLWMASLTYLADACAAVGDRELGRLVYAELLPHSGTSIMIGHGVACYGAADRYLGMLAAADGDLDLAERHLAAALDVNRRMGARTWQAHTAFHLGRVLAAGGEDERAAEHLAEAADLAERIGMRTLLARIRGREAPVAAGAGPDGLSAREVEILRLVARGRSNRDIGRHLSISEHTAANHIRSILRKTGCTNRTEAAAYAHSYGLTGTGAAGR